MSWQVIDTPGILDHPLEERNVIEMQSITALAHLRAAVLYLVWKLPKALRLLFFCLSFCLLLKFSLLCLLSLNLLQIDISEACGYSLEQQVSLFLSIKPLFVNKPLLVVANKTDICPLDSLPPPKRALVESILSPEVDFLAMSTLTSEGMPLFCQLSPLTGQVSRQ